MKASADLLGSLGSARWCGEVAGRHGELDPDSAIRLGRVDTLAAMVKQNPKLVEDGYLDHDLLIWAAECGRTRAVAWLLKHGAKVNAGGDGATTTPLHAAANFGHVAVAEILLKQGAKVDIRDDHSRTPLYRAANYGYPAVALVLLKHQATVDARSAARVTPLSRRSDKGSGRWLRCCSSTRPTSMPAPEPVSARCTLLWGKADCATGGPAPDARRRCQRQGCIR